MKKTFKERVQNFKKDYLELLKKYDLEVAGYVLGTASSVSSELWLYDIDSDNNRACLYEVTRDGTEFDPVFEPKL